MSSSSSSVRYLALDDYLEQTMDEIDPDYRLMLNEGHLKSMMRALMNLKKVEFDQKLRTYKTQRIWNSSRAFCLEHLRPSCVSPTLLEKAPQFNEGLENMERFHEFPEKLFSFMARGRIYKGKFDCLLQDAKPEIVDTFHDIFREVSEKELLEDFANEQEDPSLRDELELCVNFDFSAPVPQQPPDGGKSYGEKGELDLVSFLQNRQENSDDTGNRLLAPTWIRIRSAKSISKKTPYVIELPPSVELHSLTTEFDAVIIEEKEDSSVRLVEVWEAKATLNPMTFDDVLTKKYRSITAIMENNNDAEFNIEGQRFDLDLTQEPRMGIFGSSLLAPRSAARRSQMVLAEYYLETNSTIVRDALKCGFVQPPVDMVRTKLRSLCNLAKKVNPTVVVSSEVDVDC